MFTGLIQNIGTVHRIETQGQGDLRLELVSPMDLLNISLGASISCSGCCLTLVGKNVDTAGAHRFLVDVSQETLSKTIIDQWVVGSRANIEPSLRLGDELGGHLVSGHVDGLARLISLESVGECYSLRFQIPQDLAPFVASKGAVTLDGVSLTVNEVAGDIFGVNIIPHTWVETTLSDRHVGDDLNIEIDMLARYVARLLDYKKGEL